MFETPIVDVTIGLMLFYVLLSLVCSSIQEVIAGLFGLRSRNLHKGIQNFIGADHAREIYSHPLIRGLSRQGQRPSYIEPKLFAAAVIAVIAKENAERNETVVKNDNLLEIIRNIDSKHPVHDLLLSLVDHDKPEVEAVKQRLAEWFEDAMDRVSGWYKRRVQYLLLAIATFVTVAVNADTIRIAQQLWQGDAIRQAILSSHIEANDSDNIDVQKLIIPFPIGYPKESKESSERSSHDTFHMVLGWALTVAAISLGAPFWFDILSKVSHLRASGIKEANRAKENDKAVEI